MTEAMIDRVREIEIETGSTDHLHLYIKFKQVITRSVSHKYNCQGNVIQSLDRNRSDADVGVIAHRRASNKETHRVATSNSIFALDISSKGCLIPK
jgi:hypothetical protein